MPSLSSVLSSIRTRIVDQTDLEASIHVVDIADLPDHHVASRFSVWSPRSDRITDFRGEGCLIFDDRVVIKIADRIQTGAQSSTIDTELDLAETVRAAVHDRAWQRTAGVLSLLIDSEERARDGGWLVITQRYRMSREAA